MPRGRSGGRRADYEWTGTSGRVDAIDIGTGTAAFVSVATFNGPATMMRCRGEVFFQLDPAAADERAQIAVGLIVATDAAVAAGIAALPQPIAVPEAEWSWYGYATISSLAETAVVAGSNLWARLEVDSKAMRKVKANEQLVMVCEVGTVLDQGGSFDFIAGIRTLVAS